jgi:hypothetical protein
MEVFDIFSTKVLIDRNVKLDINRQEMMEDIDNIIVEGDAVRAPLYQSHPILFQNWKNHWSLNWENLMHSFKRQVENYLALSREMYGRPEQYEISYMTSWFYRKDMENLNDSHSNNPIHNHFPAQVVGIYYLDNPGFDGTTLYNPNTSMHQSSITKSYSLGTGDWIIFPGWMQHCTSSSAIQSRLNRTVIACNSYLKVVE